MSSVHCPKVSKILPMDNCQRCGYIRKEDDPSSIWCRYMIGRTFEKLETKKDKRYLYSQVAYKEKLADRLYKTGKTRIADEISREIMILRKEIKQYEIETKAFNQEEKTNM